MLRIDQNKPSTKLLASLSVFVATALFTCQAIAENVPSNLSLTKKQRIALKRRQPISDSRDASLKGWDHFFKIITKAGVEPQVARAIIEDKRMPKKRPMHFKLKPKESNYLYRKHNNKRARQNALRFYKKHKADFKAAEKKFGVHRSVILSILQVETKCGAYTGTQSAFHRLARLSSAADVRNIIVNLKDKQKKDRNVHYRDVYDRAVWLENEFLPHAVATIKLAKLNKVHPLEIKGSPAGAIGLFQFLPGNVFKFGIDGNSDGKTDPFDPQDAIPSIANFLGSYGWNKKLPLTDRRHGHVIWNYNRSDAYIKTVLTMARQLAPQLS